MAKAIKLLIISFFSSFFTKWLEDFFIFAGLALMVFTTYLIGSVTLNILAGNYLLSMILIVTGVFMAKR